MAKGGSILEVFIFCDGEFVGTEMFSEKSLIVGRDPSEANLVLDSTEVSRKHAVIENHGRTVTVRDLGSTNGIYINDTQATGTVEVDRLDEMVLGNYTLKVKLVGKQKADPKKTDATKAITNSEAKRAVKKAEEQFELQGTGERIANLPAAFAGDDDSAGEPATAVLGPEEGERLAQVSKAVASVPVRDAPSTRGGVAELPSSFADDIETINEEPPSGRSSPGRKTWAQRIEALRSAIPKSTGKRRNTERFNDDAPESSPAAAASEPAWAENEETIMEPQPKLSAPHEHQWDNPKTEPLRVSAVIDDDDDPEESIKPNRSLVQDLLNEEASSRLDKRLPVALEVMTFRGDAVADSRLLFAGEAFWVGPEVGFLRRRRARDLPPRFRMVKFKRNGEVQIRYPRDADGTMVRDGRVRSLTGVVEEAPVKRRPTRNFGMNMSDVVDINNGGYRYHLRFVNPPEVIQPKESWRDKLPGPLVKKSLGGSFATHIAALVVFSILMPAEAVVRSADDDRFIEVELEQKIELEEPEPPPPEPVAEPEPPPPEPKPQPKPKKRPRKRAVKSRKSPAPTKRPKKGGMSPKPAGVLGMLAKRGRTTPGPQSALAAVSNVSAAKVPGGASDFKLSGTVGKMPTSKMSLGGGGGGMVTKGGAALMRGGGGAGRLSGRGKGRVGGMVQKAPRSLRAAGQGSLDKAAIQKVINKNISAIQRCYERELLRNPGLSGKVQVEWVVTLSGGVRSVRQKFSNLNSTGAVTCILNNIKGWKFPKPKGGEVVVTYPFIFKSIAF